MFEINNRKQTELLNAIRECGMNIIYGTLTRPDLERSLEEFDQYINNDNDEVGSDYISAIDACGDLLELNQLTPDLLLMTIGKFVPHIEYEEEAEEEIAEYDESEYDMGEIFGYQQKPTCQTEPHMCNCYSEKQDISNTLKNQQSNDNIELVYNSLINMDYASVDEHKSALDYLIDIQNILSMYFNKGCFISDMFTFEDYCQNIISATLNALLLMQNESCNGFTKEELLTVLHNNTNYYDIDYKNCLYEVENLLSTILAVVTKMSISLDDLNSIRSLLYHILVLTDIALLKYTGEI